MRFVCVPLLLTSSLLAQDSQLLSEPPADWQPPVKTEVELVPLSVKKRQFIPQDGRVVTVEECEAPRTECAFDHTTPVVRTQQLTAEELAYLEANYVEPVRVWLTAKVVVDPTGKEFTLLKAKVGEEECTVWSNVNYAYLQGANSFEAYGIKYQVDALGLALYSKERVEEAPVKHRELYTTEANIVLTERVSQENAAYLALEDIHTMYNENVERLKLSYEKREENRKLHAAWKAANPEEPKDITIQFWKRNVTE